MPTPESYRRTTQRLAPVTWQPTDPGDYDIYPAFPLGAGAVGAGWDELAAHIAGHRVVIIDGYGGVAWDVLRASLDEALSRLGRNPEWHDVATALHAPQDVGTMIAPFLGGDDPLWGTRFTGTLADFFNADALAGLRPAPAADISIVYGTGAALAGWDGHLVYCDVPKNEIQFRSRAGSAWNIGAPGPTSAKEMYKRFYFVDWPALNRHKETLLPAISTFVDAQRRDTPTFTAGTVLRKALATMSRNVLRARPWFEPGPWGGNWIREHIPSLPPDVPNYAWSFELIVPENGLMFQSDGRLLETSFDLLMYQEAPAVLGRAAARFGTEFPIRFDFLDTFGGGNLSVQCHPRPEYIREHFGESFTQDETYYILDCSPGARVYLGFREDINPAEFRAELERSHREGVEIDVERFVNTEPAQRGDLFLIPNGTIHCSGTDNLVLEISATPYIFTFKMYDWMRRDLDGNPRPLNIARAYENLYFDRKGAAVRAELVSQPTVISHGSNWRIVHLPTHRDHFYDVRRYEFETEVSIDTADDCHVMSLVEGTAVEVITAGGMGARFNFAETFVVPAAAGSYRIVNLGTAPAKVVLAYVKHDPDTGT